MYALDLKNFKWEPVHGRGEVPIPRDEHTALIYENSMIVFGGFAENGERVNEIYRYYFKENKWEKVLVLGGNEAPSPRVGHSAVIMGDSLVIFGGKDNGD
jgi:N-acetylneuraminic acid mutarotase